MDRNTVFPLSGLVVVYGVCITPNRCINHWIGLRENLQETMVFTIQFMGVSGLNFPLNQASALRIIKFRDISKATTMLLDIPMI